MGPNNVWERTGDGRVPRRVKSLAGSGGAGRFLGQETWVFLIRCDVLASRASRRCPPPTGDHPMLLRSLLYHFFLVPPQGALVPASSHPLHPCGHDFVQSRALKAPTLLVRVFSSRWLLRCSVITLSPLCKASGSASSFSRGGGGGRTRFLLNSVPP